MNNKMNTTKNNKVREVLRSENKFWSLADKVKLLAQQDYIFDMTMVNQETGTTTCLGFNYCDRVLKQTINNNMEVIMEGDYSFKDVYDTIRQRECDDKFELQIIYNSGVECIIL